MLRCHPWPASPEVLGVGTGGRVRLAAVLLLLPSVGIPLQIAGTAAGALLVLGVILLAARRAGDRRIGSPAAWPSHTSCRSACSRPCAAVPSSFGCSGGAKHETAEAGAHQTCARASTFIEPLRARFHATLLIRRKGVLE